MNNKMIGLIVNSVIAIICVVGVYFVFQAMQTEVDPDTSQAIGDTAAVDTSVSFSMLLIYFSLGLIGVFTVWAIINNPKRFVPVIISLVIFSIVILIGYLMANGEATGLLAKMPEATEGTIKWTDAGLKITFILIAGAIGLMVIQMVRNVLSFFSK